MYPKWDCQEHEHMESYAKGCCHEEKEPCDKPQSQQVCFDIPKYPCKPQKECVETFKCSFRLYRISYYRLFKQCGQCGHEFDHHHHQGICPKCGRY